MIAALPPELAKLSALDARSGAKHAHLSAAMLAAVASGHWRPGQRVPTEAVLARTLPFSLGTVQRALRQLANDGVLVRRKRSGTFVAAERRALEDPLHCRFLSGAGTACLPIYPKIVYRALCREQGPWSKHLGTCPTGYVRIDRSVDVDGEFNVYSKFYLDAARFRPLLRRSRRSLDAANFKLLLAREFKTPAARFAQTLQIGLLPRAVNLALQLPPQTIGSMVEIAASARSGAPIYFQQLFIPPNSRQLVVSDALGA